MKAKSANPSTDPVATEQADARVTRVQVGCGPHNLMKDWCNVDIRGFKGVDRVMDVTAQWPFSNLDYIYGEHFLEHLPLEGSLGFLSNSWESMKTGGVIRLSTPSLEWVLSTHFDLNESGTDKRLNSTFATNRAFHGWGHQFLYSKEMLQEALTNVGWDNVTFCEYGKSSHEALNGVERHGGYSVANGYPSVWVVEATKSQSRSMAQVKKYIASVDDAYIRYVRAGH